MIKIFVLDTNVLLHNADCLSSFEDNIIILPITVIEELDKFKVGTGEINRNARQVSRTLDSLRIKGGLHNGVNLQNGGKIKTELNRQKAPKDFNFDLSVPDHRILLVAYSIMHEEKIKENPKKVILVSKDINLRLKADALGIEVQDYDSDKVNIDELYTGWKTINVKGEIVDILHSQTKVELADLELPYTGFSPNEFVFFVDEANIKHGCITCYKNGELCRINEVNNEIWHIKNRNIEQRMAMELLMDPEIKLVTLVGQAGTGKTLLALAAALQSTIQLERYEKISVLRPIIPLGKDIGYMPGDKDEKLSNWMKPIFDNLSYLMEKNLNAFKEISKTTTSNKIKTLLNSENLELEALSYARGRSIPRQFIVMDESQNLTPHEAKTMITRAGEGTKIVLTGDPYQIDNPYLDSSSNGLTYTVERMREKAIHGHITLKKSERSELATIAAECM